MPRGLDPVREFIRAFNERDVEGFVAVLDPEVELHSMKGLRKGLEAARTWATRKAGGVQQTIELDRLYEDGTEGGAGRAVALIVRRWHWDEGKDAGGAGPCGAEAGSEAMAWLFELHDHRVLSWRPYEDRNAALRAAGFEHGIAGE